MRGNNDQKREDKMKKLILIALLLVASPAQANQFNFTGLFAERIDIPLDYWATSTYGNVGGPQANNSLGYAAEFIAEEEVTINRIVTDLSAFSLSGDFSGFIDVDFIVYQDTTANRFNGKTIPDINSELGRASLSLEFQSPHTVDFTDLQTDDINLTLSPGTYWLAYERDFGQSMAQGKFTNVRYSEYQTVTPEPMSLLLLGSGLIFLKRRINDQV